MTITIVILSLLCVASVTYSFLLKRDIAGLRKTLSQIGGANTNQRLTTATFDKDISGLVQSVNDILEKQEKIRQESRKANDELRRTITNISHDLRTPLTSIMGYIQMMSSGKTPAEKREEYLHIIESRLKVLSSLMDELFEFTQIMEGNASFKIDKINICNTLRDVVSLHYEEFTAKQMTPQIDMPQTAVFAYCDENALKRIAQNLLKNALTHGDGDFRITVQPDEPTVTFENTVANTNGLDAERLFERFYTADAARTQKNTGLGLAIAKELTERMGGEISAEMKESTLCIKIRLR